MKIILAAALTFISVTLAMTSNAYGAALISGSGSEVRVQKELLQGKLHSVTIDLFSLGIPAGQSKITSINEEAFQNLERDVAILNRSLSSGKNIEIPSKPTPSDFADAAGELMRTANREELVDLIQGLF